jgi:hypothetical protein
MRSSSLLNKTINDAINKGIGKQIQYAGRRRINRKLKERGRAKKHGADYWEE